MGLLLRILWGRQSKWQFAFAAVGFWIGLLIMLLAIQVYVDVNRLMDKQKANDQTTFLIVNKEITLMNTFNKGASGFEDKEVDSLRSLAAVEDIGIFKTNSFKIEASMQSQLGFSAPIPFESLPDKFLDTVPEVFVWNEKENFIPVILSSELLRFYNLGVALTNQDMPQLPPSVIQMFPFDVKLQGNGKERMLKARVVGYSDRLPAVLVPEAFMEWANANYGHEQDKKPGRILLQVKTEGLEQVADVLKTKGYQINQEQLRYNNAAKILKVVVSLAGGVGLLFLGLSFIIFLISFQLVISRARNEINLLLDIGYTYGTVSRILTVQFAVIMGMVILTVYPVLYYAVKKIHHFLVEQRFEVVDKVSLYVIIAGLAAFVVVMIFNSLMLRTNLRK
jgi:hypothetical protein